MSETEVKTEVQFDNTDDLDAFSGDFFGQKPAVEEKPDDKETKPDAEQDDDTSQTETSENTDAQNDDEQDEAELEEEIPEKPKRKTVQDRIDEIVRQREELRRESAAEIAKLRQELDEIKKGKEPVENVPDAKAKEPLPDAVNEDGDPIYPLGEFDPQYIRDLARYTIDEERKRFDAETAENQRQQAALEEQQALQNQWNEKLVAATETYPDLVEKGQALLNNFNDLDQSYAGYLSTVIMSMEKGPDVLYYLSNHPEEATAIVNSGARNATLALGRIESRFLQSEQEAPKPKVTKAPAPPIARARGTNGAFIETPPDTDDLNAFEAQFFRKK